MNKAIFFYCFIIASFYCNAQPPDVSQLHETAKKFMRQGDYGNAVLVLNRAVQQDPGNVALGKDLAMSYYFQKDNAKALEIIKPVLENANADDQCFQIAGNIYKQLDMLKECEKMYRKGIRKFHSSGPLYNEYGELLWSQKNFDAIRQWEKGIEEDAAYARNYYNAAKYYFLTADRIWCILYGEIFINTEPLSQNTAEIKDILLESYKQLFSNINSQEGNKDKNAFTTDVFQCLNNQSEVLSLGINTETLTMVRARFILEWNKNYKSKFSFKLFDYQQQLLREGLFDAYNQWVFGSSQNLSVFQNWTTMHKEEYTAFINFQKGRTFKVPQGQYYH